MLSGEKFLEQKMRETARIVADDAVLFKKIIQDHAVAEFLKLEQVNGNLLRALTPIALGNFR